MGNWNDLQAIYKEPVLSRNLGDGLALVICYGEIIEGQLVVNSGQPQRAIKEILGSRDAKGEWGNNPPKVYKVKLGY